MRFGERGIAGDVGICVETMSVGFVRSSEVSWHVVRGGGSVVLSTGEVT